MRALLLLALLPIGLFAYNTATKAKRFADQLKLKVISINLPKFGQGMVSVPVNVSLTNPVNFSLSIKELKAVLYKNKEGQWIPAGNTDKVPDFIISAQSSQTLTIGVTADIKELMPSFDQILSKIDGKGLYQLRADISGKVEGIPVSYSEIINV